VSEEKINFRYWVKLCDSPDYLRSAYEEEELIGYMRPWLEFAEEIESKFDIEYIDFSLIFKTRDFEEAKKIAGETSDVWAKYFPDQVGEPDESRIEISAQPRCEKCDYDGRFSDDFCPKCGEPLEKFPTYMMTDLFPNKP